MTSLLRRRWIQTLRKNGSKSTQPPVNARTGSTRSTRPLNLMELEVRAAPGDSFLSLFLFGPGSEFLLPASESGNSWSFAPASRVAAAGSTSTGSLKLTGGAFQANNFTTNATMPHASAASSGTTNSSLNHSATADQASVWNSPDLAGHSLWSLAEFNNSELNAFSGQSGADNHSAGTSGNGSATGDGAASANAHAGTGVSSNTAGASVSNTSEALAFGSTSSTSGAKPSISQLPYLARLSGQGNSPSAAHNSAAGTGHGGLNGDNSGGIIKINALGGGSTGGGAGGGNGNGNQVATVTTTFISPTSTYYGQGFGMWATVTTTDGQAVTQGSVTWSYGNQQIITLGLDSTGTTPLIGFGGGNWFPGGYTFVANYSDGSTGPFAPSQSGVGEIIQADNTLTMITTSMNPSIYGDLVTFTAYVINLNSTNGSPNPTGTVTFVVGSGMNQYIEPLNSEQVPMGWSLDGFTMPTVGLVSVATVTVGGDSQGLYTGAPSVIAEYFGNPGFAASEAGLNETVNLASTYTAIPPNYGFVFGQTITLEGDLYPTNAGPNAEPPTGTMTFSIGQDNEYGGNGTPLASIPGGQTTYYTLAGGLAPGTYPFDVAYSGNENYLPSSASSSFTVSKAATTLTLSSSANPQPYEQPVTFTADLSVVAPGAGTPTGTISFVVNGTTEEVVPWQGSPVTYTTSTLPLGLNNVYAVYSGDPDFAASSYTVQQDTSL